MLMSTTGTMTEHTAQNETGILSEFFLAEFFLAECALFEYQSESEYPLPEEHCCKHFVFTYYCDRFVHRWIASRVIANGMDLYGAEHFCSTRCQAVRWSVHEMLYHSPTSPQKAEKMHAD